jgi:hypothetical protein
MRKKVAMRSTAVEVILRMLFVKHLYGWSYEATERWGSDSLVWRQCCRVSVAHGYRRPTACRREKLGAPQGCAGVKSGCVFPILSHIASPAHELHKAALHTPGEHGLPRY